MGKRKASKEIVVIDLESSSSLTSDGRHQISKHRSCWKHILANLQARKRRLTKKDNEAIDGYKVTAQCFQDFPCRDRSERKTTQMKHGNKFPKLNKELESRAFEIHFESLWNGFSEDKRAYFAYFDCLWFSLYRKATFRTKVLTWIKPKSIFSKKYVFVPIVIWHHWSLLIFCNFDERLESKTRKPCMLLLDSLESADPKRLEPDIRKFVSDIYRTEERLETRQCIRKIPLLVPQVPQQRNDWECGNFVLYFIKLFMDSAPENFTVEDYPYFMKRDWFTLKGLDCFCRGSEISS